MKVFNSKAADLEPPAPPQGDGGSSQNILGTGDGGGILVSNGTLTLSNSTVTANAANDGGGQVKVGTVAELPAQGH